MAISMEGRGRAFDNMFVERLWRTVKYEDSYLRGYSSINELTLGLTDYFQFYNAERPHQSLGNLTPDQVSCTGKGGGASVPDHFTSRREAMPNNGHTAPRPVSEQGGRPPFPTETMVRILLLKRL